MPGSGHGLGIDRRGTEAEGAARFRMKEWPVADREPVPSVEIPEVHRHRRLSGSRPKSGGFRLPWAWFIGLPALAIVVWLGTELVPEERGAPAAASGGAVVGKHAAPSRELTSFVEFARDAHVPPPGSDVTYVRAGLRRLWAALHDLAGNGPGNPVVEQRLAELQRLLPTIGSDGGGNANARTGHVREAFLLATGTMDAIATERTPGVRPLVQFVRDAALSIAVDRPLASQMEKVEDFFQQAGYAVIALAPSSAALSETGS
jgi:hypothetical protein